MQPITSGALAGRCDLRELSAADLYPFRDQWGEQDVEYVLHWYDVMKGFIQQTAEKELGPLVAVS